MKKFLVVGLTLAMLLSMSVSAFAAPGAFVKSPSANGAPTVVSFSTSEEGCDGEIVVTPYKDRTQLSDSVRAELEKAYGDIVATTDLATLNSGLADIAKNLGIASTDLAVSDLFDVSYVGCTLHDSHKSITVTLKSETIQRYAALLHLKNGVWDLIEEVEVNEEENTITFSSAELSPFAVVVDTSVPKDSPQTGDNSMILLGVMGVAAAGLVVIAVTAKKRKS